MKRPTFIVLGSVVAIALGATAVFATFPGRADATVISVGIYDYNYTPGTLTIPSGTVVVWTNYGLLPHTVTANDNSFDSGTIMPGTTYSYTFNTGGSFWYHCRIHPGMTGSVTVTPVTQYFAPAYMPYSYNSYVAPTTYAPVLAGSYYAGNTLASGYYPTTYPNSYCNQNCNTYNTVAYGNTTNTRTCTWTQYGGYQCGDVAAAPISYASYNSSSYYPYPTYSPASSYYPYSTASYYPYNNSSYTYPYPTTAYSYANPYSTAYYPYASSYNPYTTAYYLYSY